MIHLGMRKYKDRHKGSTFVLFGSGPSMLDWKDEYSPSSIKVGCNTVFMHKPNLDYYFIQDSGAVSSFIFFTFSKLYFS